MRNFFRGIIRASSFFRKEIFEILRQPRLVATLVVGPFLILFIFGIGYRAQGRTLRTLLVLQPDSPIAAQDIQQYGETLGSQLTYGGATGNQAEALPVYARLLDEDDLTFEGVPVGLVARHNLRRAVVVAAKADHCQISRAGVARHVDSGILVDEDLHRPGAVVDGHAPVGRTRRRGGSCPGGDARHLDQRALRGADHARRGADDLRSGRRPAACLKPPRRPGS